MKNYQKVALGTVSVLAAFTLVACGSSAKSKVVLVKQLYTCTRLVISQTITKN
jgi:major membrane immunogen (membrane-anchored lipoprotein)